MSDRRDGMNYAPKGKPRPVVKPGEFRVAAMHLDHGHIFGMCNGLSEAGAEIVAVYDPEPARVAEFQARFPRAQAAADPRAILDDPSIHLVAAAAVPCERGPLGCRVMESGKDYFSDKTPFTETAHLEQAKAVVARTGRKYAVYYGERLHSEAAVVAGDLVKSGAIGRVVQVLGLGPHRLRKASRPAWFFEKAKYGGILCDIGSHQCEQFLFYTGAADAQVTHSAVGNFGNADTPELEDYGETALLADGGATGFFRVDWFTPDGLRVWGDGRTVLLGTEGYIEMRKYINVGAEEEGNHLFLVDGKGEQHLRLNGQIGYPFFGQLVLDCLNRTETAMTQAHAFKAAELCLQAQARAIRVGQPSRG